MSEATEIEIGAEYRVKFPFYLGDYIFTDKHGQVITDERWTPGCRGEPVYPDDGQLVADGEGEMVLTVVDRHKPAQYLERVFYTRKFIDPDGNEFGKGKLHICTVAPFIKRATSYLYEYKLHE